MNELTKKELAELLLAAMYEETESLGHTNFFLSIDEIAVNVGIENRTALVEASRLLEEEGHILLAFDHRGAMSAFITPSGEELVTKGGETGIIEEYRRFRSTIASVTPSSDTPPSEPLITFESAPDLQSEGPAGSQDVAHVIASMELLVHNDPLLNDSIKNDLAVDLKTLELQMSKKVLNKPLVELICSNLKNVTALSPLVDLLISIKVP